MTDMGYLVWTLNPILSVLLAAKDKKGVTKQTNLIFIIVYFIAKYLQWTYFNHAMWRGRVVCAFWMEKSIFWIQTNHKKW